MPRLLQPELIQTASLRKPRFERYVRIDNILTGPNGHYVLNHIRLGKVVATHPIKSWNDHYEEPGLHFSRRMLRVVKSSVNFLPKKLGLCQRRLFRYKPIDPFDRF